MRRVTIRELSGDVIRNSAGDNELLGVTSKGSLVGVLVPVTTEILRRLAVKDLDELLAKAADVDIAGATRSDLRDVLHDPPTAGRTDDFVRLSIRGISGSRLERAASDGKPIVVTSDRVVLAVFVPVETSWTDRAVEESITRFLGGSRGQADDKTLGHGGKAVPAESIRASGRRFSTQGVIGIRIVGDARSDRERIVGVVTDGLGKPKVNARTLPLERLDEAYVFEQILKLIAQLSSDMADGDDLIGVGIEIGGHVSQGRVVRSANIHWDQFPLASHLSEYVGVPVVLENDANALAIYEQMQGISVKDFAVVLLTHLGVGSGLILNDRLYRGSRGMAAELGHIPIGSLSLVEQGSSGSNGEQPCRCGNHDCLEGAATPHAIELGLRAKGFKGSYEDALKQTDNDLVRTVFAEAGTAFGKGLATVLNLLNPEVIVIYGPMDLLGPPRQFHIDNFSTVAEANEVGGAQRIYSEAMVDSIRLHAFSNSADTCQFIVRIRSDEHGARAAAASVIRAIRDRSAIGAIQQRPFAQSEHGR